MSTAAANKRTLVLFDVDGTLTVPRKLQTPEMRETVQKVREAGYTIGVVGGSDLKKQEEQLGADVLQQFDFLFSENGLLGFKDGVEIHRQNLVKHLGNDNVMKLIKFTLRMVADLDIPIQRGTFFELRNGMINISPIGRNCSQEERDDFEVYDKEHNVRPQMIEKLQKEFGELNLKYSIGGQISFDVFPMGWDKTYCLQFVDKDFDDIHFFGDKTFVGGNDHEIYESKRTIGHAVKSFEETIAILKKDFLKE